MNIDDFLVDIKSSIRDAVIKIEKNTKGIVFIQENSKVVGCATDGDIRRALLNQNQIGDPVSNCINRSFVFLEDQNNTRENVLKLLDSKIKLIPILDHEFHLKNVVSMDTLNHASLKGVVAKAKSPLRISFGGGGTDLTQFFYENDGVVLNATINKFSYATLIKRSDSEINLISHDLNVKVSLKDIKELKYDGNLDLIKSAVKLLNPNFGFDLHTFSDVPKGSGLGGSAVVLSSVIGAFNTMLNTKLDSYEIAELAFQAERIELGYPGGWQDQYATVFGGFNFMEFKKDENIVHPLRISQETISELESSLILCYTGLVHETGQIHHDQKKQMSKKDVKAYADYSKELAYEMKSRLLKNKLTDFGHLLNEAWQAKKKFSSTISNGTLDQLYDFAIENGALGGKLLGAGGGGYFIFFAEDESKYDLYKKLEEKGYPCEFMTFDTKGLSAWISK